MLYLTQKDQIRHGNQYGEGVFSGGLSDAIAFAQMRRTVCQRLLEFYDEWQHRTNLMNAYA